MTYRDDHNRLPDEWMYAFMKNFLCRPVVIKSPGNYKGHLINTPTENVATQIPSDASMSGWDTHCHCLTMQMIWSTDDRQINWNIPGCRQWCLGIKDPHGQVRAYNTNTVAKIILYRMLIIITEYEMLNSCNSVATYIIIHKSNIQ